MTVNPGALIPPLRSSSDRHWVTDGTAEKPLLAALVDAKTYMICPMNEYVDSKYASAYAVGSSLAYASRSHASKSTSDELSICVPVKPGRSDSVSNIERASVSSSPAGGVRSAPPAKGGMVGGTAGVAGATTVGEGGGVAEAAGVAEATAVAVAVAGGLVADWLFPPPPQADAARLPPSTPTASNAAGRFTAWTSRRSVRRARPRAVGVSFTFTPCC